MYCFKCKRAVEPEASDPGSRTPTRAQDDAGNKVVRMDQWLVTKIAKALSVNDSTTSKG